MDDVQDLARRTGEEVADWRDTLNGHTKTLNALRKDQVDQGKRLARVEKEVHAGFDQTNENFTEVEKKFDLLFQGQDRITKLLTRHLGGPDEETRASGADE